MALVKAKISGAIFNRQIEDGKYVAMIDCIELLKNQTVYIKGNEKRKDIIIITFLLKDKVVLQKRFFFSLTIGSKLVDLIEKAIGRIPDYIDDLDEMIVGKKVILDVKNNETDDRCYSNIMDIYSIDLMEKYDLEDNIEKLQQ